MKKIMASDILFLEYKNDYEITIDYAKQLYIDNSLIRYDDNLFSFIYENLKLDKIYDLNNIIIINYINKVNSIIELNCSKENLYNIAKEYNEIRNLFTNSNDILNKLYDLNIAIINKYGYTSLSYLDLFNHERGNYYNSFHPIIDFRKRSKRLDSKCIDINKKDINLSNLKYRSVDKYALLTIGENEYFGLFANAYLLNNKEMMDLIFNNIVLKYINNFNKIDLNLDLENMNLIYNNDLNKDWLYISIINFIKDYNLNYKIETTRL